MKIKNMSLYMKIYLSAVAVLLVLLVAASGILWAYLNAYETAQPKYVADSTFEKYFKSGNIGELLETYAPEKLTFENKQSVNRGFSEDYNPEDMLCFPIEASSEGDEQYAVASGNTRIAYFTLTKTDESAGFGFKNYKLKGVKFFLSDADEISVKLRKGQKLFINGKEVESKYISEPDIEDVSYKYMPKGVDGIKYDKYTVSGFLFQPEITVKSAEGKALKIEYSEAEKCYIVPKEYNEDLKSSQSSYVISAVKEYAKFLSNNTKFSTVAPYLDRSSEIYDRIRSVMVTWMLKHTSYRFEEEKALDFYEYADGVYSCRVTMKQILVSPKDGEHTVNIDVTLYLKKSGGKYIIYELVNN